MSEEVKSIIEKSIEERRKDVEDRLVAVFDRLFETLDAIADGPTDPKKATHPHWEVKQETQE